MKGPESIPPWKQIVGGVLWGRRGVVKTMNLWLPLALIVSADGAAGKGDDWRTCFQVFAAVACWSLASILVNDLADRRDDVALGKKRWASLLPASVGIATVSVLYGLGILALLLAGGGAGPLLAYLSAVLLGLFYSVRPVRLKGRGVPGLLAYSLSGTFAYVVLPWIWLGSTWRTLAILAPAVLLDKWVNLHFHQVADYGADRMAGMRTFAVSAGLGRARLSLKFAAGLSALSLLSVLVFVAFQQPVWGPCVSGACVAVVLAVGCYKAFRRSEESALVRELPWPYLGLTYAGFRVLPIMLFTRLALLEPRMWAVVCVVTLLVLLESWQLLRYPHE